MERNTVYTTLEINKWNGEHIRIPLSDIVSMNFTNDSQYKVVPYDEAVDLGLSVLWAVRNVGAIAYNDAGKAYAWGMLESSEAGKDLKGGYFDEEFKLYNRNNPLICGTERDVARKEWGGEWRMPTKDEIDELVNKCKWKFAYKGLGGFYIKGPSGNSIFLPAGYETKYYGTQSHCGIWSGTKTVDDSKAYCLCANENYVSTKNEQRFYHGVLEEKCLKALFIRPVLPNIK